MSKIINLILIFLFIGLTIERENSIYYNKNPDAYLGKEMGLDEKCSEDNCPPPNTCGSDDEINACVCHKQYANYPFIGKDGQYCQYRRKKQLIAFLWELFLNIGIGHYYIKQILRGVLKTIIMGIPIVIFLLGKLKILKTKYNDGNAGRVMWIIMVVFVCLAFAWWVFDIIFFGLNKYRDNIDVPLQHW